MKRMIVCVKPVPDPKAWDRLQMDPVSKTLIREGIPSVINPLDKHAVEAALEMKDLFGAEVILLSMAPVGIRPLPDPIPWPPPAYWPKAFETSENLT